LELFRNRNFATIFCFNSKPSFSFDSWRQLTKFPVTSAFRCNHRRIGLESKLPSFDSWRQLTKFPVTSAFRCNHRRIGLESKQTACFDLQFCHCHLWNHIPQTQNTNNQIITDFLISKLWVKTRILRSGNRITTTPQILQSWKNVIFHFCKVRLELLRNRNFATNFCFNSKPSFSFDSIGQKINILLPLHLVTNHRRIGLESKLTQFKIVS